MKNQWVIPGIVGWLLILLLVGLAPAVQAGPITLELLNRYKQRVALDPSDTNARLDLAMAYCRTVWVETCYIELVMIHNQDPQFVDKALKRYQEAVRKNPNDIEARFRLSFAYFFKDQKRKAIQEQEQILAIDPTYVWAYNYLAFLAYMVENNLPKAIQLARRAAELEPTNAISHFLLGQGYYKAGMLKAAAGEMAISARLRTTHQM